ncbi:UDP-4-amino-4,6-dideoxy-N-acetyl-beta-L-altrosamine transaminase [Natranaerovirga pectinivora]|uniref:UDP-4-amino-4, 6-dideoxy-N-acetyl-beta-L-altrosamine transaminase n=1 Tax=Natranaerovirga pectinivora TaxID=682400 RepID=A0A4R3MM72_9FIRM|nr:UDP-4-amino-4,6-dideoxy-N-acetyl-beta-L-altrosamine transaminase [Natranaerovirga pectinivora]TCT14040.1 UDP-4-amino-4,6-dideoxy-N-acetyl-beta-L-altrosamine transaminase [Natranaerovirga pectinivora]
MKELLAVQGGKPVRKNFLPYGQQWIGKDDIKAIVKTLKSEYLTTGPKISEFEEEIANYVGAKYAIVFSSGTAALHAACFAAEIKEEDEVITTPMTFVATANSILYQGGKPVFADIDRRTYNIDPKDINAKITKKTKAIIPVSFTGQPVDLEEIINSAKRNNILVIEDGSHSLGANYKDKKVGTIADMTVFSFHPVKNITTGEGGAVTTNSKVLYQKLLLFRTHGITRDKNLINNSQEPWYYEQLELGFNYRITDIQCAMGISQLRKIDWFINRRKKIANKYNEAFKDNELLSVPYQEDNCFSSWHLYIIQLNLNKLKVGRKEIFEALRAENIGVNVHYIPVYYHPYYNKIGYYKGICPNAEFIYDRIITLPLFPKMKNRDVRDVIESVIKVLEYFKKH